MTEDNLRMTGEEALNAVALALSGVNFEEIK